MYPVGVSIMLLSAVVGIHFASQLLCCMKYLLITLEAS